MKGGQYEADVLLNDHGSSDGLKFAKAYPIPVFNLYPKDHIMYDSNKNLIDRRELLKIKLATLVFEAGVIRDAEQKQLRYGRKVALPEPFLYAQMHDHRVKDLRRHARNTGLALGFIRGKSLPELEPYAKNLLTGTDWRDIRVMCGKYGSIESQTFAKAQEEQFKGTMYGTRPKHVFKPKVLHPAVVARKAGKAVPVTE